MRGSPTAQAHNPPTAAHRRSPLLEPTVEAWRSANLGVLRCLERAMPLAPWHWPLCLGSLRCNWRGDAGATMARFLLCGQTILARGRMEQTCPEWCQSCP